MKTYKNIALATDFSNVSINAYQYARHLATQLNAELTVVHAFNVPVINPLAPDYISAIPSFADLEALSLERLTHFVHEEAPHEGNTIVGNKLKVKTEVLLGMATDALIEYSKNASIDLLILGISANHDWLDKLLGSVAIKVMKEAHCATLIVPEKAEYEGIKHILYTVSADSSSNKDVDDVINFAHQFDAALHYVHVTAISEPLENDLIFKKALSEKLTHLPYKIERVTAATVAEGINAYCLGNPIDVVVTVTQHRRFWDDLMHYSIAKELGWQTHLPILCLHGDDHKNSNPA